ncbi:universal stress protein [Aquicoccus sp.]|uniref:universal stress protein n=1 Tax=Aquicoccus sp. TaxID=2055851 RepID=UPI00356429B9
MKKVLLAIDLAHQEGWDASIEHAVMLSRTLGAELHVLTVIPDYGMAIVGSYFPKDYSETAIKETEAALDTFIAEHFPHEVAPVPHVRHGTIYKEITGVADHLGVDMIVMASHRPEMKDYLLGPNAARVVRHARQSVTVIR